MDGGGPYAFFAVIVVVALLLIGGMQCQSCKQKISHLDSAVVGLNRRVTVYANDGSVIREWEGKFHLEDRGGTIRFLDNDGDAITIGGTFVVEENPAPRKEPEKKP